MSSRTALVRAAEDGAADAQFALAVAMGADAATPVLPLERDPESALQWLTKAATQGHAKAMVLLGRVAAPAERLGWLHRAAELESPEGMLALGQCYLGGDGVAPDGDKAVVWLERAVALGHAPAMAALADCLLSQRGESTTRAEQLLQQAADLNDAVAAVKLGAMCEFKGDLVGAVAFRRRAAGMPGCSNACLESLARYYLMGDGVAHNVNEAAVLLRRAATNGSRSAALTLSDLYLTGDLPMTPASAAADAFRWHLKAAFTSPRGRLGVLADMLRYGRGALFQGPEAPRLEEMILTVGADLVPPDADVLALLGRNAISDFEKGKGMALLRRAAEAGSALGMFHLSKHDSDPQWLVRAAEAGSVDAMVALGEKLEAKFEVSNAVHWFRRAADRRDVRAWAALGRCQLQTAVSAGDAVAAIALLRQACDGGSSAAMLQLAEVYDKGVWLPASWENAAMWRSKAQHARRVESAAHNPSMEISLAIDRENKGAPRPRAGGAAAIERAAAAEAAPAAVAASTVPAPALAPALAPAPPAPQGAAAAKNDTATSARLAIGQSTGPMLNESALEGSTGATTSRLILDVALSAPPRAAAVLANITAPSLTSPAFAVGAPSHAQARTQPVRNTTLRTPSPKSRSPTSAKPLRPESVVRSSALQTSSSASPPLRDTLSVPTVGSATSLITPYTPIAFQSAVAAVGARPALIAPPSGETRAVGPSSAIVPSVFASPPTMSTLAASSMQPGPGISDEARAPQPSPRRPIAKARLPVVRPDVAALMSRDDLSTGLAFSSGVAPTAENLEQRPAVDDALLLAAAPATAGTVADVAVDIGDTATTAAEPPPMAEAHASVAPEAPTFVPAEAPMSVPTEKPTSAPASVAPVALTSVMPGAPASVAPASVTPASVAPASVAPETLTSGAPEAPGASFVPAEAPASAPASVALTSVMPAADSVGAASGTDTRMSLQGATNEASGDHDGNWGLQQLPQELVLAILDELNLSDLIQCRKVCRAWRASVKLLEDRDRPFKFVCGLADLRTIPQFGGKPELAGLPDDYEIGGSGEAFLSCTCGTLLSWIDHGRLIRGQWDHARAATADSRVLAHKWRHLARGRALALEVTRSIARIDARMATGSLGVMNDPSIWGWYPMFFPLPHGSYLPTTNVELWRLLDAMRATRLANTSKCSEFMARLADPDQAAAIYETKSENESHIQFSGMEEFGEVQENMAPYLRPWLEASNSEYRRQILGAGWSYPYCNMTDAEIEDSFCDQFQAFYETDLLLRRTCRFYTAQVGDTDLPTEVIGMTHDGLLIGAYTKGRADD